MSENEKKDLEVSQAETKESKSEAAKKEKKPEKKESKVKKAAEASRKWFRELKSEFKKIVWPTRKQLMKNTAIVMAVLVVVGLAVALIDIFFQSVILDGLLKLITGI